MVKDRLSWRKRHQKHVFRFYKKLKKKKQIKNNNHHAVNAVCVGFEHLKGHIEKKKFFLLVVSLANNKE